MARVIQELQKHLEDDTLHLVSLYDLLTYESRLKVEGHSDAHWLLATVTMAIHDKCEGDGYDD